jgi:hypothetical protein
MKEVENPIEKAVAAGIYPDDWEVSADDFAFACKTAEEFREWMDARQRAGSQKARWVEIAYLAAYTQAWLNMCSHPEWANTTKQFLLDQIEENTDQAKRTD